MNVERAIKRLLDLHARAEVRMDRRDRQIEAMKAGMKLLVRRGRRLDKFDAQLDKVDERLDKVSMTLEGIGVIQEKTDIRLRQIAKAQARTDQKFDKLIVVLLKRPPNGKG